jgi:hypothetical protein
MNNNLYIQAKILLEQNRLFDSLEPAVSLANTVFIGEHYVVRIAKHEHTDHAREAEIALHALKLGIRTAQPLFWAKHYSIFERLNGSSAAPNSPDAVWLELLKDLKLFHAHPFEPKTLDSIYWDGGLHLLESIFASSLSPAELRVAKKLLQPHTATNLVFAHGDAWSSNIITRGDNYLGLIDWGNAAWSSLEKEVAWLEDAALKLALKQFDLNLTQLYARRLELLLWAGMSGRGAVEGVRCVLEDFENGNLSP